MNAIRAAAALCIAAAVSAQPALAQSGRDVRINGQHMNAFGLALLDVMNCGQPVPDGRYWIDWNARTWGYEGSRASAPLPDCSDAAAPARQGGRAHGGGRGGSWEDRTHEDLCIRGGRCDVDIVINPVYR